MPYNIYIFDINLQMKYFQHFQIPVPILGGFYEVFLNFVTLSYFHLYYQLQDKNKMELVLYMIFIYLKAYNYITTFDKCLEKYSVKRDRYA